jgi:hypothetical protein
MHQYRSSSGPFDPKQPPQHQCNPELPPTTDVHDPTLSGNVDGTLPVSTVEYERLNPISMFGVRRVRVVVRGPFKSCV